MVFPEVVRFEFGSWDVSHFEDRKVVMPPDSAQSYYWLALNRELQESSIVILESDISPSWEQVKLFRQAVEKEPYRIVVAPYLCYSNLNLTKTVAGYVVSEIKRQDSFDDIDAFTIVDKTITECDGIGFGMTYIPMAIWKPFWTWREMAYRPLHALDYDMSKWLHWTAQKARIVWECEPIHLHGKEQFDNTHDFRLWASKLPLKLSITDLLQCNMCHSIDIHYVPDLDQIVCKTCNQWMAGEKERP